VTGWLLILSLLVLGGILSTLGDRLGTKVGKARLSIFRLRPKSTAVLITVFTGSIISAISLAIMVAFNSQLRVGLFELEDIQAKITKRENELKKLEKNLYALRSGNVVIRSGQSLLTKTIKIDKKDDIKKEIENILQQANYKAFNLAQTNKSKYRRILLVRKDHIENLEKIISDKRSWVVNIKSAGNILRDENYVYAFPEVILNKNITRKGEIIASENISLSGADSESIRKKIKLLLSSTLAEVKRRGSLSSELKVNATQINNLGNKLFMTKVGDIKIISKAMNNSQSADKVSISLELQSLDKN
tara:strand:- start:1541 stop:2452 length:912 start_codon:yes stop_codon:yes gene_type:complete